MGKPSIPEAPTTPTASEIAAANIETAEHMAKLSRAMEFGEELMRDVRSEDGSRIKYEKVKTDVPTGYEPVYSSETINTSGPSDFSVQSGNNNTITATVNSKGELSEFIITHKNGRQYPYTAADHLIGKPWHSEEVQNYTDVSVQDWKKGFSGSQPLTSEVKTLTGYESPDGPPLTANQYFKTSYDANGNVIGERELVERDEAVDVDFAGMGDIDRAVKRWEWEKQYGAEHADFLLDFSEKYGPDFVDKANELLERSDPTGHDARELLGQLAMDYTPGQLPDLPSLVDAVDPDLLDRVSREVPELGEIDLLTQLPEYRKEVSEFGDLGTLGEAAPTLEKLGRAERPEFGDIGAMEALRREVASPGFRDLEYEGIAPPTEAQEAEMGTLGRMGTAPTLERLLETDIPEIPVDPESLAGREFAEREYIRKAQSGETARLMADEARRGARGRAAALGNIFGGGAVLEEAAAVRQAEEAGQRIAMSDLMGYLGSGQTAGDYQTRIAQQNLANKLMGIQQRTGAETGEFGLQAQGLGMDQQAILAERRAEMETVGQRVGAKQLDFQNEMARLAQKQTARESDFQSMIQSAGFQNEATLRKRADELGAISQKTAQQQQDFSNLSQIVSQINQARGGEFGLKAQALEFDTSQRMRERADELSIQATRNEVEEAEYRSLITALGQQAGARQSEFAMGVQATDQRNQAAQADFANQQQALSQRNQLAQQAFASSMQKTMTEDQMQQQQMSNLQSFRGLQPVAAQYGMTGPGAQQSAAGMYQPPTYQPTNVMGMLQGQQQMAASNFGTQAGIWGQQAKIAGQPSGFGQLAGTVAGGLAGGPWGAALGAKMFGGGVQGIQGYGSPLPAGQRYA